MLRRSILMLTLIALVAPLCAAQETPASVVAGYDALADTILALAARRTSLRGGVPRWSSPRRQGAVEGG